MSSSSYAGRHRAPGRHGAPRKRSIPRALTPQFALPSAAAATLILTTTGATMAGSAPVQLQEATPIDLALAQSQVTEVREDTAALAERQAATTDQAALLQGRAQEDERIAREKQREAEAKAKAEEEARKAARAWVLPMKNYNFTSGYGQRWGRLHAGIDLAAPIGTPVYSASSGVVVEYYPGGACGKQIYIEHWDGTTTRYCHLDSALVSVGQQVASGQQIANSGNTGRSTGPHLHFEVFPNGKDGGQVNPIGWLESKGLGL